MRTILAFVGAGVVASWVAGCQGTGQRGAPEGTSPPPVAAPAAPAVVPAPPAGSAAGDASALPAPPVSAAGEGSAKPETDCDGDWKRLEVTDAAIDAKDGKHVLTVKAKTASHGWKVEIRPVVAQTKGYVEFEVVGLPPEGPAAQAIEERTVSQVVDLGERAGNPILVYGIQAAIFAQ